MWNIGRIFLGFTSQLLLVIKLVSPQIQQFYWLNLTITMFITTNVELKILIWMEAQEKRKYFQFGWTTFSLFVKYFLHRNKKVSLSTFQVSFKSS